MIIAALLILALGFAGYWIADYATTTRAPWGVLPWFGGAAVLIIVVGFVVYLIRSSRS